MDTDAYRRWIRAYRPPFEWFAGLLPAQQEALAVCGDEHDADRAIAIGYAVQDPQAAEASVDGDEATLVARLAATAVQRMLGPRSAETGRTTDRDGPRRVAGRGHSFLGRAPDGVVAP